MPDPIYVIIPGKPIAKGRPRMGHNGRVYTPERTSGAQERLAWALREACPVPLEGPLCLDVTFCFKMPKSFSKTRRQMIEDGGGPWYTGRPDLDNLVKLLCDSANGVIYKDDAQVVWIEATKQYDTEDKTIVTVSQV